MDEKMALTQAALLFAAILALVAIALAAVRRFRNIEVKDTNQNSQIMTNFRDLYEQGGLSDEEFRTIRTKLASQLKADLRGPASSAVSTRKER